MLKPRLPLTALALATMLLSGCGTAASRLSVCPHPVAYSREFLSRAADELDKLPADSAIGRMMADYGTERAMLRECR